jgi:hypothetical protein
VVIPFPPTGDKWQISTAGGVQPTWRADGRELYFLTLDATMMAVDIHPEKHFEWGKVHQLFYSQISISEEREQYVPAPDGRRFLFVKPLAAGSPFNVVLNWTSLLNK